MALPSILAILTTGGPRLTNVMARRRLFLVPISVPGATPGPPTSPRGLSCCLILSVAQKATAGKTKDFYPFSSLSSDH